MWWWRRCLPRHGKWRHRRRGGPCAIRSAICSIFDATATLAATDAEAFKASVSAMGPMDDTLVATRAMTSAELLAEWRVGRSRMLDTFRGLDTKVRLPWYGPPMSAMSFANGAPHGDVGARSGRGRCAARQTLPATDRLRHVADIGVRG